MTYEPVFFDIETTGLHPLAQPWWNSVEHGAMVICVGIGTVRNWRGSPDDAHKFTHVFSEEQEYVLLKDLKDRMMEFLDECHGDIDDKEFFLVGWNSRQFDHPYIGARYSRLRLNGHPFSHGWKRLDLMRVAKNKTGRYRKQDEYVEEVTGKRHDDDITGSDVPDLYENNRVDKIMHHCRADIRDLIDVFMADREPAMQEFYDHYDIDRDAVFLEEI